MNLIRLRLSLIFLIFTFILYINKEVNIIFIILKFILKNICEKKFRTFLIVFSIMISSALLFASTAMSGTLGKMYADRMKQYYGSADLLITNNENSSTFPIMQGVKRYTEHFEYMVGAFNGSAVYKPNVNESVWLSLFAVDYDDLQTMNPFSMSEQLESKSFSGEKIIISRTTADKYKLAIGDYLDLSINNVKYKYLVWGIAQPSGIFADNGMNIQVAVPKEALSLIYNAKNREGTIYLKLKEPNEKKDLMKLLAKEYPRHSVKEPFSKEELASQTAPLTTAFLLMTVIVFFMSAFIVHSSFKVLTVERLPVIGTFRSVGATRKMTDRVLLFESSVYSIIGGLCGCVLGIGILYILSYMSRPMWLQNFVPTAEFSLGHLILTFITAIALGLLSSILPIIKVARIPVKDIILNSVEKKHSKKRLKLVIAIISIIAAVAIPPFINPAKTLPLLMVCMLLSIVSVVLFVPYLINFSVMVFGKIYGLIFGNEGILAVKNLKDNKSIVNNISLLAIGLSSLLMINIVSSSVGKEVVNVYNDLNYDIWLTYYDSNTNFEKLLRTVDGVGDVSAAYEVSNIEISNINSSISVIDGINKNNFSEFWDIHIIGDTQKMLNRLEEGRNIMISKSLKERFNVKEGDFLELKFEKGIKSYKIIGFFNTLMYNGDYSIVSDKYLKSDATLNNYSNFYIKTTLDPDVVCENINKKFPKTNMYLSTMEQMEIDNTNGNNQMFAILNGFSIMSLIIGIFGVLNNFVISFLERKHWLAVYRSIGMNKVQIVKMLFIESLTGGIIGGIAGIASGFVLIMNIGYILKGMNLPIEIHLTTSLFIYALIGGITITILASISPALKSSKMNIMEAIKYE